MEMRPRPQEEARGGNIGQDDRAPARWAARVRAALQEDRLALYAQPIFGLKSGRAMRHELLVRMVEGSDVIEARDFVQVAERDASIARIDAWVLNQAVDLAGDGMPVNANVSLQSLEPDLLALIERRLVEAEADPANLVLELRERQLMQDEERSREIVAALRELGVKVAVDQFGMGDGGLSYLRDLQATYLKINRDFVADLRRNPASRHAIEAIVRPARRFGPVTVAVGVEDLATLQTLEELGVDQAQGYALRAPAPVAQLERSA
jgi:EAL domain-containing protein (putative c-di-GMP-specific phosphodiesterase class I)